MKLYNDCFRIHSFNYVDLSHYFFSYRVQNLIFYDEFIECFHWFHLEVPALRDTIKLIYLVVSCDYSFNSSTRFSLTASRNYFPVLESMCCSLSFDIIFTHPCHNSIGLCNYFETRLLRLMIILHADYQNFEFHFSISIEYFAATHILSTWKIPLNYDYYKNSNCFDSSSSWKLEFERIPYTFSFYFFELFSGCTPFYL